MTVRSSVVVPVVLSGGSGTRLWPSSREDLPKQFLPLVSAATLFQETLSRAQQLGGQVARPVIVCNQGHRDLVRQQARGINVEPMAVVLEPAGRNTAAAVTVAALLALAQSSGQDAADPLLLVLPADHVILDVAAFVAAVRAAMLAAAEGYLVTFGVVPDRPETGYGYIRCRANRDGWSLLDQFVEKPDAATAKTYVDSGYLWNSGMFLFSASALLREIGEHEPAVLQACRAAVDTAEVRDGFTQLGPAFLDSASISIDYAVMEKTKRAAVVPLVAGWSDVGSWSALHDVLPKDSAGNVVIGDTLAESCSNCYISASSRFVATVGLEGVVVVETADAVLVMSRDRAQQIKNVVDFLKAQQRSEVVGDSKSRSKG